MSYFIARLKQWWWPEGPPAEDILADGNLLYSDDNLREFEFIKGSHPFVAQAYGEAPKVDLVHPSLVGLPSGGRRRGVVLERPQPSRPLVIPGAASERFSWLNVSSE